MKLVVLESPLAGDVNLNKLYARACMRDCLFRGEAPFASHLLYDQCGILYDLIPSERELGIEAGFYWGDKAELTVVYTDLGISNGMKRGIDRAERMNRKIEMRILNGWVDRSEYFETFPVEVKESE
jgi:hypothetical protein